jgi:hypothetical protein
MSEMTRREILYAGSGIGLSSLVGAVAADEPDKRKPLTDRDHVLAAGMTPEEADCWAATADAAGKFFALPKLHPMDAQEVASAIHIIQNKLLSRPTYRKYLESAKSQAK